jgi:outer membrane receptor for ferrienterochelin and colicins
MIRPSTHVMFTRFGALLISVCTMLFPAPSTEAQTQAAAQSSSQPAQERHFKTKPTRKQVLAMKFEELSQLSLEELAELSAIVGVQSVDELLKLLVNTASKTNERLNDTPGVVSVITAREIELFGAQTLEDVLNYMVSVNLGTNFLYPENVNVRGETSTGVTNNHILFLLNGRPLRETLIGGIYTELLIGFPLAAIERIELVRGPGSVLYGSGAFTATFNIITKPVYNTALSARGGSFGTITASAQSGISIPTSVGDVRVNASAYYHTRPDWSVPYTNQVGMRRETGTYNLARRSVSGLLSVDVGGFHAQALVNDYSANVLGVTPLLPTIEHSIFSVSGDVGYKHKFSDEFASSLNVTAKHYQSRYESRTNAQDYIVELTNYYEPNQNFKVLLGGFLNARQGTIVNATNSTIVLIQPYNQLWFTAYTEVQWQPIEALRVSAGVQLNKPERTPLDLVPRVNAVLNFTPELGIKAIFGQAYRAPSAFENFLNGPAARGNLDLVPEKVSSWDVEAFWETEKTRLSLVYFNGLQTDVIRNRITSGDPRPSPANTGTFLMEGIEFEGKYTPTNDLYVLASALIQRNFSNSTIANTLATPPVTIKLGAGYDNHDGIALSLFYTYTAQASSTRFVAAPNAPVTNPIPTEAHLLSANLNLNITDILNLSGVPAIILNARVENIFDALAWTSEAHPNTNALPLHTPRGVYGGIIIKF